MRKSLTQKLIERHLLEGSFSPGTEIAISIDQVLTQDATGTMVALEFEALGMQRVGCKLAVSYVDHNLLQADFRNADDHRFLRTFAARYGLWFSPPGNGVCHQLHMLFFGRPGASLLGSDSHTPHGGGLGMLAIGAGGLDVAVAMAGEGFYLRCPKVLGVRLTGRLGPWVTAKDVILELLRRRGVKGGLGMVVEYYGPGVQSLSVAQRAAITNMGAELGATTSVFPSDERTREFLAARGREEAFVELKADPGCDYDEHEEIDLGALEPMVAKPSSPGNVVKVRELGRVELEQVIVGSCGGGFYEDLALVASVLKAGRVPASLSLSINPGSREALAQLVATGAGRWLVEAGARLHQCGCLGCIGIGQAPATGAASLRTFPRNFPGRSGTPGDQVYLCGPAVAAASALAGFIADPRELGPEPWIPAPPKVSANAMVPPPEDGSGLEVVRGPNIKPLPTFDPLPDELVAKVLLKLGDDITTDHILPGGGKVLPLRSNIEAISEYVFRPIDEDFPARARQAGVVAVVGGQNYGQGSSREHAALAPRYLGVRVKLALSFARIHRANLVNFGILPLVFADPADYERLQPGDEIRLSNLRGLVGEGAREIPAQAGGKQIKLVLEATGREREILLAGGLLNYIRSKVKGR